MSLVFPTYSMCTNLSFFCSSLEVGKRADLVVFDGDPLEYASHACVVMIGGELVSEACR